MADSDEDDDKPGPSRRPVHPKPVRPKPPQRTPRKPLPPMPTVPTVPTAPTVSTVPPEKPQSSGAMHGQKPGTSSTSRPAKQSVGTETDRRHDRTLRIGPPAARIMRHPKLKVRASSVALALPKISAVAIKTNRFRHLLRRKPAPQEEVEEPEIRESYPRESQRASIMPRRMTQDRRDIKVKASRILYTTDEEVRDALMEFGVFIIFLILTSLVTLSVRHSYMFYFNDTVKKLFTTRDMVVAPSVTINFEKLITVPDLWDYIIFNFLVTLHGDMTVINDDGSHFDDHDHGGNDAPTMFEEKKKRMRRAAPSFFKDDDDDDDDHNLHSNTTKHLEGRVFLHENLLLGPPRLRQIRVRKDSCYVNDAFIRYFNTCYSAYSSNTEEIIREHGGAPYKTMSELDSTPLWTTLSFYRSGGYTIDLSYIKSKNMKTISQLKNDHWLDRGTRLCVLEFNLYNENTDVFQSVKFIAEMPPTGGIIPQCQLQTVKHFSFISDKSMAMCSVYIFWYIMVLYYNIFEINAIRKCGFRNYFSSVLNILDAIILLFCYLALAYNIWHTFKVKSLISKAKFEETYLSLDTLCFWNTIYVDMMAILAFLVWIKIFKFISFNKTLVQFTTTLKRCSKDLAGFSLMFGIVFLAYAQLGLLLFGTKHPDFRNFITSILTMIRMILGDFQYNLIEDANRVLGPIYFLTYILLVFFILLNMFLAIIMETYNSVKGEITQGRSQLGSYIYKKLKAIIYFVLHCGHKRQAPTVRFPNAQEDDDEVSEEHLTTRYQQPKISLRRNMTKTDTHYFEDVPQDVQDKDMFRLNNRVSLLEEILEQLITNMDGILKRVENEIKKNG